MSRQGLYLSKMATNAYLGATMAVLGPNILIFQEEANVLVPAYQENHLGTSVAIFWSNMTANGPERSIFGQN